MGKDTSSTDDAARERRVRDHVPGLAVLVIGAVISWSIAQVVPLLNVLLVAIFVGFLLANVVGVPDWAERGVRSHKVILGAAIVLMGSSLTVDRVVDGGLLVVLAVAVVTTFTLVTVELFSRGVLGIDDELGSLLAAGSSICGVSAIVAVAGSIRAREEHIIYAASTILFFDAVTLVVYPAVGGLLSIPDRVFGIWAGISMFSTGPTVAVGFAHSETAGQWATITKLTRNTLIGVLAVGYATYYARNRLDDDAATGWGARLWELWERFPKFVAGFVALMLIASAGVLSAAQIRSIEHAYNWLFILAFVGLGTELRLEKLRCTGIGAVMAVFVTFCVVSVLSLAVLTLLLA